MHSLENGTPSQSSDRSGTASGGPTMKGGGLTFAVMVTVLLVALIFAANQNDVIGWLLVIISGAWLLLAILVVLGVRRGARSVSKQMKNFQASVAPRAPESSGTRVVDDEQPAADPMRDTKLDHSFKIVQVQARVVDGELAKGDQADTDMIARALETITITSSNARGMLKESASSASSTASTAAGAQTGPTADTSSGAKDTDGDDGTGRRGTGSRGARQDRQRGRRDCQQGQRQGQQNRPQNRGDDEPLTGEVIN